MNMIEILFFALALAFCWVNFLKPIEHKPFNCIKCMTGWFSFLLYAFLHLGADALAALTSVLYLAAGVFIGAIFEAISMRYL